MRWFLDTQLYSYFANGTIAPKEWLRVLAGRELWLSPFTAYELLKGLLNSSHYTEHLSVIALREVSALRDRILSAQMVEAATVNSWLYAAGARDEPPRRAVLPASFYAFRESLEKQRKMFLARLRGFVSSVGPNYRRIGDPLFSSEWQRAAGREPGENLDAAFVFLTAVLDRTMRIRYNPEKHPSDYIDCLQLRMLNDESLAFISADRKLVRSVSRSLQSDRIYLWEELAGARPASD